MATLLVLCLPTGAASQLSFLDAVFRNVSDVNASYLVGWTSKGNNLIGGEGLHGVGFEVALTLASIWEKKPPPGCPAPSDTTANAKQRRNEKPCNNQPSLDTEVSIGYSQLGGFRRRADTLPQLRGGLENLPAIGMYLVFSTGNWVNVYLGARTGLAQLKGFQAFLPDSTISLTATGSTWQVGYALGMSVGKPSFPGVLFVELESMYRRFDDIHWTASAGPVPNTLRVPTYLSTFVVSVGGQIAVNR
jgi:opacity protein-like surface antigen